MSRGPTHERTHRLAAWNIASGGYATHSLSSPFRHEAVAQAIDRLGADTVVISDAFGWGKPGVLEQVLPEHPHRYFATIDDSNDKVGPRGNVGVAIATTAEHEEPRLLDLGGRKGLLVPLHLGRVTVNLVGAYLYWADEERRKESIEAILDQIDLSQPTIVAGDLNAQVPLEYAGSLEQLRSILVRLGASALGLIGHKHAQVIKGFEERTALKPLHEAGFTNLASTGTPTAAYPNPFTAQFRIDHIYAKIPAGDRVQVDPSRVGRFSRISDHLPVQTDLHY